jgi:WD40 repeat protein
LLRVYRARQIGFGSILVAISLTVGLGIVVRCHFGSSRTSANEWRLTEMTCLTSDTDAPCEELCYSPQGTFLAGGTNRGKLIIWAKGMRITELQASQEAIYTIAFSCDEKYLASLNQSGNITIWDTTTWRERLQIPSPTPGFSGMFLRFINQASYLVCQRKGLAIIDWRKQREITRIDTIADTNEVAITPDEKHVLSLTDDGVLQEHELATGRLTRKHMFSSGNRHFAIAPKHEILAIGGGGRPILLWDLRTWRTASEFHENSSRRIRIIRFCSDESIIVSSASLDGGVRLWSVSTGQQVGFLSHPTLTLAFSTVDSILALGGRRVLLFQISNGLETK